VARKHRLTIIVRRITAELQLVVRSVRVAPQNASEQASRRTRSSRVSERCEEWWIIMHARKPVGTRWRWRMLTGEERERERERERNPAGGTAKRRYQRSWSMTPTVLSVRARAPREREKIIMLRKTSDQATRYNTSRRNR